jgi:hypothetical protein
MLLTPSVIEYLYFIYKKGGVTLPSTSSFFWFFEEECLYYIHSTVVQLIVRGRRQGAEHVYKVTADFITTQQTADGSLSER